MPNIPDDQLETLAEGSEVVLRHLTTALRALKSGNVPSATGEIEAALSEAGKIRALSQAYRRS